MLVLHLHRYNREVKLETFRKGTKIEKKILRALRFFMDNLQFFPEFGVVFFFFFSG